MVKVVIKASTKPNKKLMATFTRENGSTKTTHFGAAGMDDFTKIKDDLIYNKSIPDSL